MINFDNVTGETRQEYNPHWRQISDCPYRILIAGVSGSGKRNVLLNLIHHQEPVLKISLHAEDLH